MKEDNMDVLTLQNIERIEQQIRQIDQEIATLEEQKENIMLSDPEYAAYVDHYLTYYDNAPLPIRAYYNYSEQLEEINALFMAPNADYETLWVKYGREIQRLERRLAA